MKQVNLLAQYYIELLLRLGLFRSSLLTALVFFTLTFLSQLAIDFALQQNQDMSFVSSVFFAIIFTPCIISFFASVIFQLSESRQRYCDVIISLEEARASDLLLNAELSETIEKLNQEIEERERIEKALHDSMAVLKEKSAKLEKARSELADQTTLLRSFLNASPDLIYYRNEKGQFSGGNKAIEALTGKSQNELIGLTPWEVYPQSDASEIVKTDQLVFDTQEPVTYEQWLHYPDGRKACFEMHKLPLYSNNNMLLGLVGFGRDITEHKSYQEALEKASRDKTTFISTISHELRTPLNAIVGFSRQLLDSKLNKSQHDQLRTIYVSAITLGQIFNGIIDMDKSDRGRLELFPEPTNLMELTSGIKYIGLLMAEQDELNFNFDLLDAIPETLLIDATRLRQILWNLLSNAFKFTKQGAINVSLYCQVENQQALLRFEVEDSGIGIAPSELENIFAMYYQVQQNDNNLHATGTGIGLAISKQNAELMGGTITVESELNFGSTFILTLSAPVVSHTDLNKNALAKPAKQSFHILLVEDIDLNIMVATSYLRKLGHKVVVAKTGLDALKSFAKDQFDFVLLDIQLPDITGFEVAKTLRKRYKNLPPIIALTANVIKDKSEYLKKGMDDAISKPFTLEDLTQALVFNNQCKSVDAPLHSIQSNGVSNSAMVEVELNDTLLDLDMLENHIECVGLAAMFKSIEMFEQAIPEYFKALDINLIAKDQSGIVFEAHKIKSAASAIGLKRIQKIANKAQSPDLPAWWNNIDDWVDEIKLGYKQDIQVLTTWLKQY